MWNKKNLSVKFYSYIVFGVFYIILINICSTLSSIYYLASSMLYLFMSLFLLLLDCLLFCTLCLYSSGNKYSNHADFLGQLLQYSCEQHDADILGVRYEQVQFWWLEDCMYGPSSESLLGSGKKTFGDGLKFYYVILLRDAFEWKLLWCERMDPYSAICYEILYI